MSEREKHDTETVYIIWNIVTLLVCPETGWVASGHAAC